MSTAPVLYVFNTQNLMIIIGRVLEFTFSTVITLFLFIQEADNKQLYPNKTTHIRSRTLHLTVTKIVEVAVIKCAAL